MCCNETNFTSDTISTAINQSHKQNSCHDNVMTIENFYAIDLALSSGLASPFFLVGAPTNIISIVIFYRQGLRDRINLCLSCLAFTDLIYTAVNFVISSFSFLRLIFPKQYQLWRWNFLVHSVNFLYGSAYSSGCLTMIIAVERCVCVMFPLKAPTLISTKTTAVLLSMTLVLIHVLCGVYAIKQRVFTLKDDFSGEVYVIPVYTDLYLAYDFFGLIENIVLPCISFFNFACVFLATISTVITLRTAQTWRKSISSHMKGQGMLMRMLVAVSCVYILCTAPNVALALARFTVPEFRADGTYCNTFRCAHVIGNVIVMFNSSLNFFVYVTMSSRFRHELKSLFRIHKTRCLLKLVSAPASQYTLSACEAVPKVHFR